MGACALPFAPSEVEGHCVSTALDTNGEGAA